MAPASASAPARHREQPPYRIELEQPRMLTAREDQAMLGEAVARSPRSRSLRYRLASSYATADRFDEAIALLRALDGEGAEFGVLQQLGSALMAKEDADATREAHGVMTRAVALAQRDPDRSFALALLGKILVRMGERDQARAMLNQALAIDPGNRDAFKRLAAMDMAAGRVADALERADAALARGIAHSRVLAVRAAALAMLGRVEDAREAMGTPRFLGQSVLAPPPGWTSIAAFNADLAAECRAHPGIRFEHYGIASTQSWRIEEPCLVRSQLMPVLREMIRAEVEHRVAALADGPDPWLTARAPQGYFHAWSVMTDADGFEEWHVHQGGWLSGVYYVEVPDHVANGQDERGCIGFGMPPQTVGEAAHQAFGMQLVRPEAGMLLTFPSQAFHRTFAHGGDGKRIVLSFDIAPEIPRR